MREKGKEKYGGVEGYVCFSLGDRACCHGAGPPIGGGLVQSLKSTDCFIIEKFSSLPVSLGTPFLLHLSFLLFLALTLILTAPPPHLVTVKEADKLHKVYNEWRSSHPILF